MTPADIDALRGLVEKATPGQFSLNIFGPDAAPLARLYKNGLALSAMAPEDAALIVAAVNSLPILLDRIEGLEAENAELRTLADYATHDSACGYSVSDGPGCTCGYFKARAAMERKEG